MACSAIEPGPPFCLASLGHAAMSVGPWQPRAVTCANSTAGVASVISAVLTLPVPRPFFFAACSSVGPRSASVPAAVLTRPFEVLCPVAQAVPVAAESGT